MAAAGERTEEDVRRDIERERDELVHAVEELRGGLRSAANVRPLLRKVVIAAVAIGVIRVVARRVVRRGARRRSG